MIVDVEHPCILNGAILLQLFQGHKVVSVDFLLAVSVPLQATATGTPPPPPPNHTSPKKEKPTGVKPITFLPPTLHRVPLTVPRSYKFM